MFQFLACLVVGAIGLLLVCAYVGSDSRSRLALGGRSAPARPARSSRRSAGSRGGADVGYAGYGSDAGHSDGGSCGGDGGSCGGGDGGF